MSGDYERLSFLDNSFLAMESPTTHFHVAGMLVLEGDALQRPDGGIDVDRIKAFIDSKLHLIPRYRQRLAFVPVERYPVWVDDAHFSIDYHIRHSSLPKPGTYAQLEDLMGRLASQQLDRSKPLWELNVVEGLEDGRFAIITKIHHAMIDGMSGVDLMAVLLNLMPTADFEPGPEFVPRPVPSGAELVLRETARRAGRVSKALRSVRTLSDDVQMLAMQGARRARAMANSLGSGWLTQATKTPLNGVIGPNRRFGTLRTPLEDVKAVKNALGGSVNDVILATVAGGVRRFLVENQRFDVKGIDFRAMAPVSVRSADQRGTLGNQVAMWLVPLPVAEPDPVKRLGKVQGETLKLKETDQALGAASLVRMSSGAPATLVSLASRLATNARPFNLTVTNVPGPQFPMYLLGAKLIRQYPLVPLFYGHGVGIALFSYDGEVAWGFNADYDVLAELDGFIAAVQASFEELLAAARDAGPSTATTSAKRPVRRSSSPKQRPPMGTAAKKSAAKEPAAKKPAAKKPATRPTAAAASRTSSSASKKPAAKKPAAKKPAAKKPAAKKPAAKKPAAKKPAAKKPVVKKPAAKKPAAGSSGTKRSTAKQPVAKKPAAGSSGTKRSTAKQPAARKSATPRKAAKPPA